MASEETEVAAQNAAPTKPRATGSSASRRGILADLRERLKRIRLIDLLPGLVLGAAVMALYTYYSLQQVKHWVTPSWDLAIFTQMAQAYSHFSAPIVPIKGPGFNLWGDHFHPILVLLGPIYGMFPSPTTLLVVQNALIAAATSAIVFFTQRAFALARGSRAGEESELSQFQRFVPTLTGLLLGAAFALSFGVQQAVAAQFHEVAFAVPLLTVSLGYLVLASRVSDDERNRYLVRACWWALPIAFVKEDMGVTAAVIGFVILIRSGWLGVAYDILLPRLSEGEPDSFRARLRSLYHSWASTRAVAESSMVVVWGIFWSVVSIVVILPYFNSGGTFDYADKVNVTAAVGDPFGSLIQMMNNNTKMATLGLLLITGAVLWVGSPLALVALPTIAWRLLSTMESYWASTWHYSLVLMPIVFCALLDTVLRMRYGAVPARKPAELSEASEAPVEPSGRRRIQVRNLPVWVLPTVALFLAVSPIFVAGSTQPLASLANSQFTDSALTSSDQMKLKAVQQVPEGVTVASDLSILTQLIPGRTVYWIGHTGEPAPEYVVIDRRNNSWGGNPPANVAQYAADRYGHSYAKHASVGSIDIVRRVD